MCEQRGGSEESKARQNGHPALKAEEETEEAGEMEGKQEQVEEDLRYLQSPCDQEGEELTDEKKVEDSCEMGRIRSQRPRSFLYSHHQSVSGLGSSTQSTNSSSSTCSNPTQIIAHILDQGNFLARRKLRGERVRPHSLYVEQSRIVEEQSAGPMPGSYTRSLGFSRVKASLVRGQERLRQAVSPSRSSREPSRQETWMSPEQANLLAPADGVWGAGGQRRAGSPETRRRRRDWRRHTVLVNMPGEG